MHFALWVEFRILYLVRVRAGILARTSGGMSVIVSQVVVSYSNSSSSPPSSSLLFVTLSIILITFFSFLFLGRWGHAWRSSIIRFSSVGWVAEDWPPSSSPRGRKFNFPLVPFDAVVSLCLMASGVILECVPARRFSGVQL